MIPPAASAHRFQELSRWISEDLGFAGCPIAPASADASFRRYFRIVRGAESFIVMDAPPDQENLGPYLQVARTLAQIGLSVPRVLARDTERGFLLLTDLGSRHYLDELAANRGVDRLYADALGALATMQTAGRAHAGNLPAYDRETLTREMDLMPEWFLRRHLGIDVDSSARAMLERLYDCLLRSAAEQPATFVHRDYHSRNLMVLDAGNPGILDFQDAVGGPVTYDLVSLLKDCYVAWPPERVRAWALHYRKLVRQGGFPLDADESVFMRWFDLMGIQRHVKVLGIFCRLYYRDRKPQYLRDLPRVLAYVRSACAAYRETSEFAEFLAAQVDGNFERAQARTLA